MVFRSCPCHISMSVATAKSGQCDGYEVPSAQLENVFFSGIQGGRYVSTCANLVALKIDVECRTSWKYFVEPTVCYDSAARGTSSLRVAGRRRRSSFSCTRIRKRSRSSRKTFDSRKSDIRASRHSWDIYERGHDTHLVHQGVNDCWSKKVNERNSQRRARAAQVRAQLTGPNRDRSCAKLS